MENMKLLIFRSMKDCFLFLILALTVQYGSSSVCVGEFKQKEVIPVTVETSRGSVAGIHMDFGNDKNQIYYGSGDVFRGIPYAMPPIGEYRWKKPARLDKFSASPWNATFDRPGCPQYDMEDISEDCLYLNIFTPNVSYFREIR